MRQLVWTAYSRNEKRVIAFIIGEGPKAAKAIYNKVKKLRPNVIHLYSDANSCYDKAFAELGVTEPHTMTKAETHLIEGSNSSFRDNLARFNRKTKRYSKTITALSYAVKLFIYRDTVYKAIYN